MLHTGRTLFHIQDAGIAVPEDHILGEHLQRQGYDTWGTGKWHNGLSSYARSFGNGAEIFFGGMNDHWNVPACRFDPTGRYDVQLPIIPKFMSSNRVQIRHADHVTPGKHSSELFCDAAVDFLKNYESENPFLMYISFMAPHDPARGARHFGKVTRIRAGGICARL